MESTPAEEAEGQAIVQVLAVVLERLVSANSHLAESQQEETKFHALRAPAIGILQYLERIHKYASCSKECFILALIYIDRLIQRNNFLLTPLNVHRVVITAVLLAAKFFDDAYYNNAYYAKVGGVLVSEMNTLECEFLFKIDFSLRVVPEVFEKYKNELISHSNAMGMNMIENYSDEELLKRVCARQATQQPHVDVMAFHQNTATAQAPALQTYPQAEFDAPAPVVYPNPVAATTPACHQEAPAPSHYPIHALHQNTMEQVIQQHANATAAPEPVFPFPTLAQQVSVQQHAQAAPSQKPSELDLVSHAVTAAMTLTPGSSASTAVVSQDTTMSQFTSGLDMSSHYGGQILHNQAVAQAPAQLQFTQAELMGHMYGNNLITPAAAPVAQPPAYSQPTNYYTNETAGVAAQATHTTRSSILHSGHPEITPSPPPQPPIHFHHGAQLSMGCGTSQNLTLIGGGAAYLKSGPAPLGPINLQQRRYPADASHDLRRAQHEQLLPSRPIAIAIGSHHHLSQEQNTGGWPCNMFSLERAGQSPA